MRLNPRSSAVHLVHSTSTSYDVDSQDYLERVYAGVLGKIVGVYLGRPVENWSYEKIRDEFGEINYYVHEQRKRNLIVTDDDISGTFTFLRAIEDYGFPESLYSEQIGNTWLNYLIEKTTILWWGGMGNSTEHTAFLRLKSGIHAPESGAIATNGLILAEQIGAQIFIDGWGLICPGDPIRASKFAERAARVSHDGEAVFGAQVVAALVAQAFVEPNIDLLLDTATDQIPAHSIIRRMIDDLRSWHSTEPDWRENRIRLKANYGYDRYRGNCHIVPNHGLIILSLLHGAGNFDESMHIVNSCGWDTDCNSGNVGTILGVRNGLAGFEGKDWRGPVADRLYLPSADGGRAISDALREAYVVANYGKKLAGSEPEIPKQGARFHFSLPGSVQGWQSEDAQHLEVRNERVGETRALVLQRVQDSPDPVRASTPVFIPTEAKDVVTGYVLVANPTLYSGQRVQFNLIGQSAKSKGCVYLSVYNEDDTLDFVSGPSFELSETQPHELEWVVPDTNGYPICEIGIALECGEIAVLRVDWHGIPTTKFRAVEGSMWARAWAKSLDRFEFKRDAYEWLNHNAGIGMLTQGHRDWKDYRVEARITPKMATCCGIAVRVQGLKRFYALVFGEQGEIRLDKMLDVPSTLARTSFPWEPYVDYDLEVEVRGNEIRAWINGQLKLTATDTNSPLDGGAFGFLVESGTMGAGAPRISPA